MAKRRRRSRGFAGSAADHAGVMEDALQDAISHSVRAVNAISGAGCRAAFKELRAGYLNYDKAVANMEWAGAAAGRGAGTRDVNHVGDHLAGTTAMFLKSCVRG